MRHDRQSSFAETQTSQTLVLLSGGIDSTACLNYYLGLKHQTSVLFIDYGQSSRQQERIAVRKISNHYDVPLTVIRVKGFREWKDGFIQGRNGFLLYTALLAFDFPSGIISLGIHSGTSYSDCSEYFVKRMQETFDIYAKGCIQIDAPFLKWTKREIWEYCRENNVPLKLTYSCELGLKQPCGKCLSCMDLEALNAC